MSRYKKNVGDWGEGIAVSFLRRRGFEIIEQNYHTTQGEIDIVARQGGDYYFVEVKTRRDAELATDLAISREKIRRLEHAAKHYCFRRNVGGVGIILAGIIILADKKTKSVKIRFAVIR